MSHFAGYLRKLAVDSAIIAPVEQNIQRRTLLALARNVALKVEQRQDSRFWLAAVSLPTWSASIMVERHGHGVGAVAGADAFADSGAAISGKPTLGATGGGWREAWAAAALAIGARVTETAKGAASAGSAAGATDGGGAALRVVERPDGPSHQRAAAASSSKTEARAKTRRQGLRARI